MTQTLKHPQRLALPSTPGERLKRPFPIAKRIRLKEVLFKDPVYLTLIRQCPCVDCGQDPAGTAAHLRMQCAAYGKRGGLGKKPADKWATPLCDSCHRQQHQIGERAYWSNVGINPFQLCWKLHEKRGDLVAMRAVSYLAIAERESRAQSLPR